MAGLIGMALGAIMGTFVFALLVSFILSKVTRLSRKKRLAIGYLVIVLLGAYVRAAGLDGDFATNLINNILFYGTGAFVCMFFTHGLGDPDSPVKPRGRAAIEEVR